MKNHSLYSKNMKMSELISSNPRLLILIPRFGIKLGFGDHSIEEVCAKDGVSTDLFLLICNVYSNQDYNPTPNDFESIDMKGLLPYLLTSHIYYLDERIPHIEAHLNRIITARQPRYGNMLKRFYEEYKKEVCKHFEYEEKTVFPYIESLWKGHDESGFKIKLFKQNHSNIEDALNDMMNILIKYLPGEIMPKERIEISLDIMQLSSDLFCHTLIENRVLVPYVESLENALK